MIASSPAAQHAACKCGVTCTWKFCSTLCSFGASAVLFVVHCATSVLEMNGLLALHVHLAGKSVVMPPLTQRWSSHCSEVSVAPAQVIIGHHHCKAAPSFFLASGEKHQAASYALLLMRTLLPTLMVSGRTGCTVKCIGCLIGCVGCSQCVVHHNCQGCLYKVAVVQ